MDDHEDPMVSTNESYVRPTVNLIYLLIVGVPALAYTLILLLISLFTPMEFLGDDWQIWAFILCVPGLGIIGGIFLKKTELQKSLVYACFFLVVYMALITSGVAGILEIARVSSTRDILFAFMGGILYGGIFGLVDGVFLIFTTLVSYGIKSIVDLKK